MTRHGPGEWYGVVSPAGVAMLPASVPATAVEQVWYALRDGQGLGAVIDGLVGAFGTSLSSLPDFAVLSFADNDAVRVAVRGTVQAHLWLHADDQPVTVTGIEVTTWNERVVQGVERAEISLPGAAEDVLLPVADGVVRAARLVVPVLAPDQDALLVGGAVRVLPRLPVQEPSSSEPTVAPDAAPESEPAAPAAERAPETPDLRVHADETLPEVRPVAVESEVVAPEAADVAERGAADPGEGLWWGTPADSSPQADPGAPRGAEDALRSAETMIAPDVPNEYDQLLFGETVLSSAEAAAVREDDHEVTTTTEAPVIPSGLSLPGAGAVGQRPPVAGLITGAPVFSPDGNRHAVDPSPPQLGDHDGETVLVEQLHLPTGAWSGAAAPEGPSRPVPKLLLAGRPPQPLDRTAIVGTRPKASRVQGANMPSLISVESPNGEISRSHVELRVEGATVLAVDLNSTNGTMLLRLGSEPVRLQPGEPSILVPGDRIDLGDGITLEFEGLA